MKRLFPLLPLPLLFLGLFLLPLPLSLFSSPCDGLSLQPGDDEEVLVTVGEMRAALCYANAYDALEREYNKLWAEHEETLKDFRFTYSEANRYKRAVASAWRWAGIFGGSTAVLGIIVILTRVLR